MASEAVLQVKQAEEQGKELIRRSAEQSKQIVSDAHREAQNRRRNIIGDADKQRVQLISAASGEAARDAETLERNGCVEREKLLSPAPIRRSQAVNRIVERIVSVNGNH